MGGHSIACRARPDRPPSPRLYPEDAWVPTGSRTSSCCSPRWRSAVGPRPRAERRARGVAGHARVGAQERAPAPLRRPGALPTPPTGPTPDRPRPWASGSRRACVSTSCAPGRRLAGRATHQSASRPELRGLRRLARRRRGAADRRRPRDGGRRRHPALRPDAIGAAWLPRSATRPRPDRARDLDRPGMEVGGGLAVGGCRPRLHHLVGALAAGRPGALDRRRPAPIPPGPSATRSSSPSPSPTRTAASCPASAWGGPRPTRRWRRWTARAPWWPARRAPRRSSPRPAGGSRSRAFWSVPARPPSAPGRLAGPAAAKAACPASSRGWSTPGGIRCPDSRVAWRSSDPSVAAVDSAGRVTRRHRRPRGRSRRRAATSCRASARGLSGARDDHPPRRRRAARAGGAAPGRPAHERRSCRAAAADGRRPGALGAGGADRTDRARRSTPPNADGIVQAVWTLGRPAWPPAERARGGRRAADRHVARGRRGAGGREHAHHRRASRHRGA